MTGPSGRSVPRAGVPDTGRQHRQQEPNAQAGLGGRGRSSPFQPRTEAALKVPRAVWTIWSGGQQRATASEELRTCPVGAWETRTWPALGTALGPEMSPLFYVRGLPPEAGFQTSALLGRVPPLPMPRPPPRPSGRPPSPDSGGSVVVYGVWFLLLIRLMPTRPGQPTTGEEETRSVSRCRGLHVAGILLVQTAGRGFWWGCGVGEGIEAR